MVKKKVSSKLSGFISTVVVISVLVVVWMALPNGKRITPKSYVDTVSTVQDPQCYETNGADMTDPFWVGFCTGFNLGFTLADNQWSEPFIEQSLLNLGEPSPTNSFYGLVCSNLIFDQFSRLDRSFTKSELAESEIACVDGMRRGYKKELASLIRDDAPSAYLGVNPPKKVVEKAPPKNKVVPKISPSRESSSGGLVEKCKTVLVPNPNSNGRIESDSNGNLIPLYFPERQCVWVPR